MVVAGALVSACAAGAAVGGGGPPVRVIVAHETAEAVHAVLYTGFGEIEIALETRRAPRTAQNFIDLAEGAVPWTHPGTGVEQRGVRYYDGLTIHRVVPGFVIQGGDPLGDGRGGPGYRFDDELHRDLRHDRAGMVSMANSGADRNGSQFFITLGAHPRLDGAQSVFGRVVRGLEVVEAIAAVETDALGRPRVPVVIQSVEILRR